MEIFLNPPFMKQILHLRVPVILLLFTGSLFCEIPKAPSLFKEWIATERLITKESSSWEIEKKFTQRAGRVPRRGEANDR